MFAVRWRFTAVAWFGRLRRANARAILVGVLVLLGCGESQKMAVQTASATIYSRSDSNATTIWAPRVHAGLRVGEAASIDAVYSLDSWTSASVDIVTAATHAIHEVRHEVNVGASYEFSDSSIMASYRYSTEPDYWSHGGVVNLAFDLAQNNTTLAFSAFGSSDIVGRAGWASFRRPQDSLGGRLSLTQVLGRYTVAQLSWEALRITGYQASPYRFVAIGGQGTCAGSAPFCVPESHPNERLRQSGVASLKQALGSHASLGLRYRFYFDDWGIQSHTVEPELIFLIGELGTLELTYRYYTQGDAYFYRPRYLGTPQELRYVTRDRKLSTLYDNQAGLTYEQGFALGASGTTVFKLGLRAAVGRIVYQAFVGLHRVDILEATGTLGLDWR